MIDPELRQTAIRLYDRFTHDGMERREFMSRMTALAGGAATATALVGSIAASPAAAALSDAVDPQLIVRKGKLGFSSPLSGYVAAPRGGKKLGVVIVVHENRGLNAHIEDVTRRIALANYFAVAPDFLSPVGGTPADEDAARDAIGKLDLTASVASAVELGMGIKGLRHANGRVGMIGFCWGGAFVNRVAVAAGTRLDAGVAYYGPAPDPSEAARVEAPLLLHYAGLDERVATTGKPWVAALKAAGKVVTAYDYPGANHAFNNDTSAERYDKAAADLAWARTLEFFARHLRS